MDQYPSPEVAQRLATLSTDARGRLLHWRSLIIEAAKRNGDIGPLVETLKWGQPSYLPERKKTGTTIRLWVNRDEMPTIFVPCSTRLIDRARERYADEAQFEGDRAFIPNTDCADGPLMAFITDALTYHLR
ncbi:MAG: DUF1801 domain-containing protein [Pseudomonadota bacterium]